MEQERSIFKRFFIRTWYNDTFRILVILIPTHLILTVPLSCVLMQLIGVSVETLQDSVRVIIGTLVFIPMALTFAFNDYSNLRRIGRNEHGELL